MTPRYRFLRNPLLRNLSLRPLLLLILLAMFASSGCSSIKGIFKDKDANVVSAAYIALARMSHWEPMIAKLQDQKTPQNIRLQALELMGVAGPAAKPYVLKAAMDAVADKDIDIADAAIATLVNINAFEAIPLLQMIASDQKKYPNLWETAGEAAKELIRRQKEMKETKSP